MIQSEKSPVYQLVSGWWECLPPSPFTARHATERRLALAIAILEEQRFKIAAKIPWNPFADARCLWAAAHISYLEDPRSRPDPNLHARAAWIFNPPLALCGKDHAAGAD